MPPFCDTVKFVFDLNFTRVYSWVDKNMNEWTIDNFFQINMEPKVLEWAHHASNRVLATDTLYFGSI